MKFDVKDDLAYLGSKEQYLQDLKGKNILLADDQEINRMVIKKMLEKFNLKIVEASNGKELLELYQKNQEEHKKDNSKELFDLIITDINMPPYNGDEAAKQIRAIEQQNKSSNYINYGYYQDQYKNNNNSVPIIALSGNGEEEDIKHFFNCQIDDYFIKGQDPEKLIKIIAIYLKSTGRNNQQKNLNSDLNLNSELKLKSKSQLQIDLKDNLQDDKQSNFLSNQLNNSKHNSNSKLNSDLKIFNRERISIFDLEEQNLIISTFLSSSSVALDKVKQNKTNNNLTDLLSNLHSIKGSCGTIGAEALYEYIVKIERELKMINPSQNIPDNLLGQNWSEELARFYDQMKQEMDNFEMYCAIS